MHETPQGTWIEHLGHTSFVIACEGQRIVIDPIIVRPDLNFRQPTCPRWFFDEPMVFDAIFVSHGHNDHLHPPSLLGFTEDTPVYFLNESRDSCSCEEDPRELLAALGFHNSIPFEPGEVIALAEGNVRIHIIPAQNSSEGEEQCCFLIETPDVLILDAVDIKDTPITRHALQQYRGRIDIAFVPTGASVQWQGFWNQMDAIEAVTFCHWLQPAKLAPCGGALSLSERPRMGTIERYPNDLADWLMTATTQLGHNKLVKQRPPFRMLYEEHRLSRCIPMQHSARAPLSGASTRPQAILTTFFTGYHPQLPTKRLLWPENSLQEWLGLLDQIRDVVQTSHRHIQYLLTRCKPLVNRTPAAVLAPCTTRRIVEHGAVDLAACITAHIPRKPIEPVDLEMSFFAVVEAMMENADGISQSLLADLRTCLWIDRNMFHLWTVYLRLKDLAHIPEDKAEELRSEHVGDLRKSVEQRRPTLTPNHFLLNRDQLPLLTGTLPDAQTAGLLCFPSPAGVHQMPLSILEVMLLERCDSRTFSEIIQDIAHGLEILEDEAWKGMFTFLAQLSRHSVLLIDWS